MIPRIYHNSRCSKSRATLALLTDRGINPEVVEYLKTPPTADILRRLAAKLDLSARDLVRTSEPEYAQAGLELEAATDDEIFALLASEPKLLQRPIVETDRGARVGRPPERVLELFE